MAKKKKDAAAAVAAAGPEAVAAGIRLSAHPRARRHIAIAKGWGGLIAFGVVVKLAHDAGLPWPDVLERGVLGGIVGYLAAWLIVQTIWRHIALAELEDLRRRLVVRAQEQAAAREAAIAEAQNAAQAAVPQS
jgi:hypothetical protein